MRTKGFFFNKEAFSGVFSGFSKRISERASGNCFILDEIGSLELDQHKGFYETLHLLLRNSSGNDICLTVSCSNLETLEKLIHEYSAEYRVIRKVNIAAVIMASGLSARFGGKNKLLLEAGNRSLYRITIENALEADVFSSVFIVSGSDEILEGSGEYWNVTPLRNPHGERGISETIRIGVKGADKAGADGYMFIPCDQVLLSLSTMRKLARTFAENSGSIVVPVINNEKSSPAVFPSGFRNDLLNLMGDSGGSRIISKYRSSVLGIEIDDTAEGFDIDTPEDYRKLLDIMNSR